MGRLFGTDGVRGVANADLTAELALDVAVAAAHVLTELGLPGRGPDPVGRRPVAVVGRDPRASGEFLENAVCAGLASAGVDVVRLGVLPTPAVAYLTTSWPADLGVMISASHNPMPDNGIKFFDAAGFKLPDAVEDEIESRIGEPWARPTGVRVGRISDAPDALDRYRAHLLASAPARLDGLRVVLDAANGAASAIAPLVLATAGADLTVISADPDGLNINDGCGSTHTGRLAERVLAEGADVGIAHDGDADRCLAVDAAGHLVDGDAILAICALAAAERGELAGGAVATTVMTNLGFKRAMAEHGIRVVQTPVGDRYVLEAMVAEQLALGGEQSGHVVFLDASTTGDGLLTALRLLGRMAQTGRPLADLAAVMTRLPQVLLNVRVRDREAAMASADLAAAVAAVQAELGDAGRVLVRPSGTEPVVRVMVEAAGAEQAGAVARRVAATLG